MPRVLIVPRALATCPGRHVAILRQAGFDVEFFPEDREPFDPAALREVLAGGGYGAVLAGSEPYTAELIGALPRLRVIARVGVGFDAVDLGTATRQKVAVTIAPGTNDPAVAEHTIALILAIGRDLMGRDRAVRQGGWPRQPLLPPVRSRTLGIVGLGRIGKAVATRAKALGMDVIAYEPFPDQRFVAEQGIALLSLEELLARADYVTLHVPLSSETCGLINRKTLALMKRGSVLINTARGGLVVEEDLAEALRSGQVAAAGLDVFQREPPAADNPLLRLDNVLLSPHIAGVDTLSVQQMAQKCAETILALHEGRWPAECVVNPEVGAGWKW